MLYLNKINQVTEAQRKLNLTLTNVVFEFSLEFRGAQQVLEFNFNKCCI